ncbi:MAG TPA: hypothetical protein PLN86_16950 [Candidatus Hydrogenedentes bacterium]|nr:hypothetical protein [Candidatus Hydrogenedentota bacterium]
MEYIQLNDDLFIEYDEEKKTSNFISKASIQNDINITSEQLSTLGEMPSDAELLAWAKLNYSTPEMRNRDVLQGHLDELMAKLAQMDERRSSLTKISPVKG